MSKFDERERAFEAKFQHDQDLRFKVSARRNRRLGMWAAEKMGLTGSDAEAYAKEVVASDFERPGDGDVLEKVAGDLKSKGLDISEHLVRQEMDRLMEEVREEFKKDV